MSQHVVVHVDGGAVVDGVTQSFGQNGLTAVGGEAEEEEAGLSSRQAVHRLGGGFLFIIIIYFKL